MRTVFYSLMAMLAFASAIIADDKPLTAEHKKQIAELKKQIAEKKAEVMKLEAELSKLEPALYREQAEIPDAVRKKFIETTPTPELKSFDKGSIGTFATNALTTTVGSVVDERSAVMVLRQLIPGRQAIKTNVLVCGIDTSNFSDGKEWEFKGVVYVSGNAKVNGETMKRLVVFERLPGEIAERNREKK